MCLTTTRSLLFPPSISAFLFLSEVHHQHSLMGRRADRLSGTLGNSQGPLLGNEEKKKFQSGHKEKERQGKLNKLSENDVEESIRNRDGRNPPRGYKCQSPSFFLSDSQNRKKKTCF